MSEPEPMSEPVDEPMSEPEPEFMVSGFFLPPHAANVAAAAMSATINIFFIDLVPSRFSDW